MTNNHAISKEKRNMAKKLTTSNIYSRWKNTVYKQAGGKSALNIYELRFFWVQPNNTTKVQGRTRG